MSEFSKIFEIFPKNVENLDVFSPEKKVGFFQYPIYFTTSGASARRVCAWGHAQTSRVLWTGPFWAVRHSRLDGLRNLLQCPMNTRDRPFSTW